jgi:AcrR family transcriptional regulator
MAKRSSSPSTDRRTRGGWDPVGTAAARRAARDDRATARGDQTRDQLLAAARATFEAQGYAGVRVADITRAAGLAHGSFYTYFASKRDAFLAVARSVGAELEEATMPLPRELPADPRPMLETAIRHYLEHFRRNGAICALFDQVALTDQEVAAIWRAGRERHIEGVAWMIGHWQETGQADDDIDAQITAGALITMLYGFPYWWMETATEDDDERAVQALMGMWSRLIGLSRP